MCCIQALRLEFFKFSIPLELQFIVNFNSTFFLFLYFFNSCIAKETALPDCCPPLCPLSVACAVHVLWDRTAQNAGMSSLGYGHELNDVLNILYGRDWFVSVLHLIACDVAWLCRCNLTYLVELYEISQGVKGRD
jgi:hypothetical protein